MCNVLVTGGAGFQGYHLTKGLLEKGNYVRILNTIGGAAKKRVALLTDGGYKNFDVMWGSITDPVVTKSAFRNIEKVFHLAAKIHVKESTLVPKEYIYNNVLGTEVLLEQNKESKLPMIFASSCEAYGESISTYNVLENAKENNIPVLNTSSSAIYGSSAVVPTSEESLLNPHSPYAATKAMCDRLCYSYYKTYGLDVKIVRPFNIFGETQKVGQKGAVIPTFFYNATKNKQLSIEGDGNQTRDYLYIDDLVDGYLLIMENKLDAPVINLASGVEVSINDIASKIQSLVGDVEITHTEGREGEMRRSLGDIHKIVDMGFKPKYTIFEGMEKYYNWFTNCDDADLFMV